MDGRGLWKNRIQHVRQIGVVFGQRSQQWWDVPVIDSFELLTDIYSIPNQTYQENIYKLTVTLNLEDLLRTSVRLAEMYAKGFDSFSSMVRKGDFDRILLRPRSAVLQVLGSMFELTKIGRMLQVIVMFLYAVITGDIQWTADKVLTVIFMLIGGSLFLRQCSLFMPLFVYLPLKVWNL